MYPKADVAPPVRHGLAACGKCHIYHCQACGCGHKAAVIAAA
jgi:hypothetical protein